MRKKNFSEITDGLGRTIDEGVLEMVIHLNDIGFETYQSCEGHVDRACPFPWVWIEPLMIDGLRSKDCMEVLLRKFSETFPDHELGIVSRGIYGAFQLQTVAARASCDLELDRQAVLTKSRKEMDLFLKFLKR